MVASVNSIGRIDSDTSNIKHFTEATFDPWGIESILIINKLADLEGQLTKQKQQVNHYKY